MLYNLQNPLNLRGKTPPMLSFIYLLLFGLYHTSTHDSLFPSKRTVVPLYGLAIIQEGPLDLLHRKYKLCLYCSKVIANLLVGTRQKKAMPPLISLSPCCGVLRSLLGVHVPLFWLGCWK